MNTLMPFRSLNPLARRPLWNEIDNLWRQLWNGDENAPLATWMPRADVIDKPDVYLVKVDVPGFKADEIEVQVTGDTLSLRGERKTEDAKKTEHYHICERQQATFERFFTFPNAVQANHVEADLSDGVLTVRVQKKEAGKPAKIAVKAH